MCRYGYPRCDTLFEKAAIQVSENQYDNGTFGKVRDITPIAGLSVKPKIVQFDRKERLSDGINERNRPTGSLLSEFAETKDKIRP